MDLLTKLFMTSLFVGLSCLILIKTIPDELTNKGLRCSLVVGLFSGVGSMFICSIIKLWLS